MVVEFIGFRKIEMDTVDERTGQAGHISGTSAYYLEPMNQNVGVGKCARKIFISTNVQPYSYFDKNGVGKYDVQEFNKRLLGVEKV